jgi:hypothetical protein
MTNVNTPNAPVIMVCSSSIPAKKGTNKYLVLSLTTRGPRMACQDVTRIRLPLSLIPLYRGDQGYVNRLLCLLSTAMVEARALHYFTQTYQAPSTSRTALTADR